MNPILKNGLVSWKTTLAGVIGFLVMAGPQLIALLNNPNITDWKSFGIGFAMLLIGFFSRDGDKSSEQTGASAPLIALLLLPALLCGCASTELSKTADAIKAANENSMKNTLAREDAMISDIKLAEQQKADAWRDAAIASHTESIQIVAGADANGNPTTTLQQVIDPQIQAAIDRQHMIMYAALEQRAIVIRQKIVADMKDSQNIALLVGGIKDYASQQMSTALDFQNAEQQILAFIQQLITQKTPPAVVPTSVRAEFSAPAPTLYAVQLKTVTVPKVNLNALKTPAAEVVPVPASK